MDTDGQITGSVDDHSINSSQHEDWVPIGDSPGDGTTFEIQNYYFDLNAPGSYNREYWKFDLLDFQATNLEFSHCGPECSGQQDIFTLSTFQNSYYIPPESFDDNSSAIVYIENLNYNPTDPDSDEYIPFDDPLDGYEDLSDLLSEEVLSVITEKNSENFTLSTPNLSPTDPISEMAWNAAEGLYAINTVPPIRDTINYYYEYDYDVKESFAALDTLKNPRIPDHMYIIDPDEISDSIRSYILYDSLSVSSALSICNQNEEACNDIEVCTWDESLSECTIYTPPVTIDREYDFYGYINEINDDFGFRKTTDCNDNYQQDPAELTMSDFESSCSGIFYFNEIDPCASTCSEKEMDEWCWEQFDSIDRVTARCIDNGTLAFCDTGNALFDQGEYLYDQDGNNEISVVAGTQALEPFEDRNCNNSWDGNPEQEIDDINDKTTCETYTFATWNEYENQEGKCFYDMGNGQWDDSEECNDDESGQSCEDYGDLVNCNCNYRDLYERGLAPSYLIVSYADEISPIPKTNIFPSDIFADCGIDRLCDKNEIVNGGFDAGTCIANNYSGSKNDCCKHNFCWNYINDECDFSVEGCSYDEVDDIWSENLDPADDNCTNCDIENPPICVAEIDIDNSQSNFNGTENNFKWDQGEEIKRNFGDSGYTCATTYLTKFLRYSDCDGEYNPYDSDEPPIGANCGGNTIEIISNEFKKASHKTSYSKYDSEVNVSSFDIIAQIPESISWLTNLDIVKTQWPSDKAQDGNLEDYMLFLKNEQSVSKLIQPYYYFANAPGSATATDYVDYNANQWWQAFDWEEDVLIPSMTMENESTLDTNYTVHSNVGKYEVTKEYEVKISPATMTYSSTIDSCLLITRVVTIEMIGPGPYFKIRSQTYLKDEFDFDEDGEIGLDEDIRLVKEVISWAWNPPYAANTNCGEDDYLGCGLNWTKISSIEYKGVFDSNFSNSGNSPSPIDLEEINDLPGFNGDPFRLSNTMGIQRIIPPPEY